MTHRLTIGVDVGGTTIKCGIVRNDGVILARYTADTHAEGGPTEVIARIAESITALQQQHPEPVSAIGLGVPGVVNAQGEVCYPPNFPGWEVVDVTSQLRPLLNTSLPIFVENDANVAALAEAHAGAGSTDPDFLFVTLGTGVGGCIVSGGHIWRGGTGGAGEVGHVSVDMNGRHCNCGSRGCIEAYAGQRMMAAIALEQLPDAPESVLHTWLGEGKAMEPKLLDEAANAGDVFAQRILTETGEILGAGIASAVNLCDLHLVVIGGGTAESEILLASITDSLKRRVLKSLADIRVRKARFSNDAGMIGAGMLGSEKLF